MTFENAISFGLGAIAINVPTPKISTPLQDMFSASDLHEIIIGAIKVIIAGLVSVGINQLIKTFSKQEAKS